MSSIAGQFNIQVSGNAQQPLVFAHGLGCDQSMWKYVTPAFENDYNVVLFDYAGSGNLSTAAYSKQRYNSLQAYADDVIGIAHELQLSNIIFFGHSVSAMIGMLAAIAEPGLFSHLVMLSPSPCYINSPGYHGGFERKEIEELLLKLKTNLAEWSETYAPVIMGNQERTHLTETLQNSFLSTDREALYNFAELTFLSDMRNRLQELTVPALIIQCTEDVVAPQEVGNYMHTNMPNSTLVTLQADGHCAHMSDPAEVITITKNYLGCGKNTTN